MAKRIKRLWDDDRTALLGQDELYVQKGKGGNNYFYAWLQDPEVEECPLCACGVVKVQDLFSKTYREVITRDGKEEIILLEYGFHKFRCLNDERRHVFAKEIHFASRRDNITYRLEKRIVELVLRGASYEDISNQFQGALTRQAIGQIFNRWVRKKEGSFRQLINPSHIAVISGVTDHDKYTLILNLDDGIKIHDIIYGVQSNDIAAVFRKIGAANIKTVISDTDPTIVETIKDHVPDAVHIIPVDYWFKLVRDDFADYSHEILKRNTVADKDRLIMTPISDLAFRISDLRRLYRERPAIKAPHKNFNELRSLINRRDEMWVFDELAEWVDGIDMAFADYLSTTITRLHMHRQEIEAHVRYREIVPEKLFAMTEMMEKNISSMRTFSSSVLRARVLFSSDTDLHNWRGIPIEKVIATLTAINGGIAE